MILQRSVPCTHTWVCPSEPQAAGIRARHAQAALTKQHVFKDKTASPGCFSLGASYLVIRP